MTETQPKKKGRPVGYKTDKTARKMAVKRLKAIVMDDDSPILAQAIASAQLLNEIEPS